MLIKESLKNNQLSKTVLDVSEKIKRTISELMSNKSSVSKEELDSENEETSEQIKEQNIEEENKENED